MTCLGVLLNVLCLVFTELLEFIYLFLNKFGKFYVSSLNILSPFSVSLFSAPFWNCPQDLRLCSTDLWCFYFLSLGCRTYFALSLYSPISSFPCYTVNKPIYWKCISSIIVYRFGMYSFVCFFGDGDGGIVFCHDFFYYFFNLIFIC